MAQMALPYVRVPRVPDAFESVDRPPGYVQPQQQQRGQIVRTHSQIRRLRDRGVRLIAQQQQPPPQLLDGSEPVRRPPEYVQPREQDPGDLARTQSQLRRDQQRGLGGSQSDAQGLPQQQPQQQPPPQQQQQGQQGFNRRRAAYEDAYEDYDLFHTPNVPLYAADADVLHLPPPYVPPPSRAAESADVGGTDAEATNVDITHNDNDSTHYQQEQEQEELPNYTPRTNPHPPLPTYRDADDELMSIVVPESLLLPPTPTPETTPTKARRRSSAVAFLSKLKPGSGGNTRIVVMTRGDYHRYWARDKQGRYVGSEPEGEGPRIWRENVARRAGGEVVEPRPGTGLGMRIGGVGVGVSGAGVGGSGVQSPAGVRSASVGVVLGGNQSASNTISGNNAGTRKSDAVERVFAQIDGGIRARNQPGSSNLRGPAVGAESVLGISVGSSRLTGAAGTFGREIPGGRSVWGLPPTG